MGIVSPQGSPVNDKWLDESVEYTRSLIHCIEPDYKELIPPIYLRKMPRILKIGLYASMMCLKNNNSIHSDAIITGSGFGCLEELEKFLSQVIESNEKILFPGSFIHSTNNLVGSQIAMMTKNKGYNMNYVHRSFSLEHALSDALMLLEEKEAANILTGCIDEITDYHFNLYSYLNYWKPTGMSNCRLFNENSPGTIAGEGSAFFNLSSEKKYGTPELKGVYTFYSPNDQNEIKNHFDNFLQTSGVLKDQIQMVLLGKNGDNQYDHLYDEFVQVNFNSKIQCALYKHLCGEYHTSAGFALGIANHILKYQKTPQSLILSDSIQSPIKNILIYNQYRNAEHSFILAGSD